MKKVIIEYLLFILIILTCCKKDESTADINKISEIAGPFVTLKDFIIIKNDNDFDKYFGQDSLKGKYIDLKGTLWITRDSVTNLEKLKNLHSVSGEFSIRSNSIKSLKGLESLTYVGENFNINTNCINLTGLLRLKEVGGTFTIMTNSSIPNGIGLISLYGLESLKKIGGSFVINGNEKLKSLEGIESLEEIGGNLSLINNPSLNGISNLSSLTSITGIDLKDMPSFSSFYSLPKFNSIDFLTIQNCNSLNGLKGIESVKEIKNISIISNKNLEQLSDLKNTQWSSLYIASNDKLSSLNGLGGPTIVQNIYIQQNNALQNLDGLSNLQEVSGTLYLEYNGIKTTEGLNKIKNIGTLSVKELNFKGISLPELESVKSIIISNHDTISLPRLSVNKLTELNLFGVNLSTIYLPGITEILNLTLNNCFFISKSNFPALNHVYSLKINNCPLFNGIMFPELESVNYFEAISNNNQDFNWIPKLKTADRIELKNNFSLKSLNGLGNLKAVSSMINIKNNSKLEDFCPLKTLVESNPLVKIDISGNSKNPSLNEIVNCGR